MSELIQSQLTILGVMGSAGAAAGLVYDIFEAFAALRGWQRQKRWASEIFCFLCIGFLSGEFLYAADYGKVTFFSICAFGSGLWLYKKTFCGTMSLHSHWQAKGTDKKDISQEAGRRRLTKRK